MLRFIKGSIFVCIALLLSSLSFAQSVSERLNGAWESAGLTGTVSGPDSYTTQNANYLTFGNASIRAPNRRYELYAVSAPSINAGCGGIDIYLGGFSFISSKQLEEMFKSIAANAGPIAFMLAMETFAPTLNSTMKELAATANSFNEHAMGSCEAAETAVKNIWNEIPVLERNLCASRAIQRGDAKDRADALKMCRNAPQAQQTKIGNDQGDDERTPSSNNFTWNSLKKHSYLTDEEREFIMTLVGTLIIQSYDANPDTEPDVEFIPARIKDENYLETFLKGGKLQVLKCTDPDKCLTLPQNPSEIEIESDEAFLARTSIMLASILDSVESGADLSSDQLAFINNTDFPIRRMVSLYHNYYPPGQARTQLVAMSETIAIEILMSFLNDIITTAEISHNIREMGVESYTKQWRDDMDAAREVLFNLQSNYYTRRQHVLSFNEHLNHIEAQIQGDISQRMAKFFQGG